ncbi:hypothetical protein [Paenibacillus alvei]|uniref:hypothetical protein n=1 Tax=Paenibacillus alvei TaxID=44250 RepID=UPI00038600B9|nr:hypothetical protein [Paenibacillus alvei]EPY11059.1 hypothetical protein PAAL66ix_19684 [Paenibacillus alvei A6-6i-x]
MSIPESNSEPNIKPSPSSGGSSAASIWRGAGSSRIPCVERLSLLSFTHGSRVGQLLGRGLPHAINWASEAVTWRKPLILL